jgi:hypothetical protein
MPENPNIPDEIPEYKQARTDRTPDRTPERIQDEIQDKIPGKLPRSQDWNMNRV